MPNTITIRERDLETVGAAIAAVQREAPHLPPARIGQIAQGAVADHRARPAAVYRERRLAGDTPYDALAHAAKVRPAPAPSDGRVRIDVREIAKAVQRERSIPLADAQQIARDFVAKNAC